MSDKSKIKSFDVIVDSTVEIHTYEVCHEGTIKVYIPIWSVLMGPLRNIHMMSAFTGPLRYIPVKSVLTAPLSYTHL